MRPNLLPLLLLLLPGCASNSIVMNEFVADNATGITDSTGTPDWVELANLDSEEVSLDGWSISDDYSTPGRHPLDGLTIPGNGYLLLIAAGDSALGDEYLSFRLSASGEALLLSDADGIVDDINYLAQQTDLAMARQPDGTGDWVEGVVPTPGAPNQ
ncbi:MAG: lamin tail domain-containing protein [Deltaproteobacteria bacterium]|nr:lamin tail domain-containing protein [Deltaproteobacteria bacterium]